MKTKFRIIRNIADQFEIIKTYFDQESRRWKTETVGWTSDIDTARRMLADLELEINMEDDK